MFDKGNMRKSGYNTNLAAEYYVLSMLYRKGKNAYLTLGNKKSIDIIVDHGECTSTIDVKGMVGATNWPMDNFSNKKGNHYIALVSFRNKMLDHTICPETFILPASEVQNLLYHNPKGSRQGIRLKTIREKGKKYEEAWDLIK